jgi:hypothetical protein
MNLKLRDEEAFWAEVQNRPRPAVEADTDMITAEEVANKFNRLERGVVPLGCTHLVAFIDVHAELLYYTVLAAANDFSAAIVDYGCWPEQRRAYFHKREAKPTIRETTHKTSLAGSLYAALELLTASLLDREWRREGGGVVRIERCLIDANWGKSTDTVYLFCRQSARSALLLPSHGHFFGPTAAPLSSYQDRDGEVGGLNWRVRPSQKRVARNVLWDSLWWKSFSVDRWHTPMGEKGGLALFGDKPALHRLYAEHLSSEKRTELEAKGGRKVDFWEQLPARENHWFDCTVGCLVAASIQGADLFSKPRPNAGARKWSQVQEEKRRKRQGPDRGGRPPMR